MLLSYFEPKWLRKHRNSAAQEKPTQDALQWSVHCLLTLGYPFMTLHACINHRPRYDHQTISPESNGTQNNSMQIKWAKSAHYNESYFPCSGARQKTFVNQMCTIHCKQISTALTSITYKPRHMPILSLEWINKHEFTCLMSSLL